MITEQKASDAILEMFHHLLPYTCPACNGRYPGSINNKGICDTCFMREAHQRAAFSLQENEITEDFQHWFIDHTQELEDYG